MPGMEPGPVAMKINKKDVFLPLNCSQSREGKRPV